MKNKIHAITIILVLVLALPISACAAERGENGRRQGPPPEAIEACKDKAEGDSVTFTGRRGESLQATCKEIQGQLAAVPEGRKSRGGRSE